MNNHFPSACVRRATAAAALTLVLSACGSMAPDYQRPAAPVPAQLPAAGLTASAGVAADVPWQSFFTDANLHKLIGLALANNRDLRVALLNVEQARATVDVRKADRWPTLNAGLGLSRGTVSSGATTTSWNAGLLVSSYELDLFDRLRSQSDAAFAQYLATTEAGKTAQISLIGSVANAYFALQADAALLNLVQQTLKTREESLRLIQLRFDKGASSQLDLSQAQSLVEAARVSLAQTTRLRLQDENALNLLLGQTAPAELIQPGSLSTEPMAAVPIGLSSELLLRRPDVAQAEQQLLAANANIGVARAAFFPKIALTASAGSVSSELDKLFSSGTFAWNLAPQLLMPLFDKGRSEANLASAKAAREVAVAQYEKAIQVAFREVADALAGRATLADQLKAQQALTQAETVRTGLVDLRYKNGASSYLEVLDAQRSLFAAQQAELQLRAQVLQNQAALYRVMGGGWTAEAK